MIFCRNPLRKNIPGSFVPLIPTKDHDFKVKDLYVDNFGKSFIIAMFKNIANNDYNAAPLSEIMEGFTDGIDIYLISKQYVEFRFLRACPFSIAK